MITNWNDYIGKKVMVLIKNSKFPYTGIIKSINEEGNGLIFISMIEKRGEKIMFAAGEIAFIKEDSN
jgi:hypothetical protein